MLKYQKLIPGQMPDLSWYDDLELPVGVSYEVKQRIILCLDEVNVTNAAGVDTNDVRSLGTDNVNKELIRNNMAVHGLLTSVQPGYVYNNDLYDGFTRFGSMLELGITHAIFNEVTLKPGFTERQMRDEIGLGANNHPPSKSATISDFKKRLNAYISFYKQEHMKLPSMGECIDWVNSIPHSFVQKQVIDLAETCLRYSRCGDSVIAVDSKDANRFASKHVPNGNVVPLNVSTQKGGLIKRTYFDRVIAGALYHAGDQTFIGFTQGIEAEDIPHFRKLAQEQIDAANEAFERAFQKRLEEGKSFQMFKLEGFVPQIKGVEETTEIVK